MDRSEFREWTNGPGAWLGRQAHSLCRTEWPTGVGISPECIENDVDCGAGKGERGAQLLIHLRCLPTFGYGPRHLGRVMRFGRALEAIRAGTPLAQVAAECRYADQAHLTREVRALAGTTPTALLREPYAEGSTANRSTGRPSGSKTTA